MTATCSNCGANVSRHDSVCSCCGSSNPDVRSMDRETIHSLGGGEEAFQEANYETAIQYLKDALDLDPEAFHGYFVLAACYSALNRHAEAIQALEKAQEFRPGSAAPSYNLAMHYRLMGRQAEAQTYFEKARALAATDRTAPEQKQSTTRFLLREGLEAFQTQHYELAIQCLSVALDLDPDLFDAHFYMGASYSALNRPAEAIRAMEKAQQLQPGSAPLAFNLGTLYKQAGRTAEAQEQFEQALALAETNQELPDPKQFKTRILLEQGMDAFREANYEAAIRHFNQVIDLDPNVFDAHLYMGASYSALKQTAEAIRAMEKAQRLRPGSAPLAYNLGTLYKQSGDKTDAQEQFEQALALAETDAAVKDQKQFKEMVEKALKEFKHWKLF